MSQNRVPNQFFCHFLKFGSIVFLEFTYNNSLQQFLTSSRSKIHEKKFWGPNLGQRDQNRVGKQVFCHFLKFGSLAFLEVACSDSLQQFLTSSGSKIHELFFWGLILAKKAKIGPETRFLAVFASLVHQFSLSFNAMIASKNVQQLVERKINDKKFFGAKFGPEEDKSGPKLCFLPFSQVWFITFLLNYIE